VALARDERHHGEGIRFEFVECRTFCASTIAAILLRDPFREIDGSVQTIREQHMDVLDASMSQHQPRVEIGLSWLFYADQSSLWTTQISNASWHGVPSHWSIPCISQQDSGTHALPAVVSDISERHAVNASQTMRMRVVRLDRDNRTLTKAFQYREFVNANVRTYRSICAFATQGNKGTILPNLVYGS
jgi:hypothetical protein